VPVTGRYGKARFMLRRYVPRTLHGDAHTPVPPSERGPWLTALALALLGAGVLAAVLSGAVGSAVGPPATLPPVVLAAAPTPTAASAAASSRAGLVGSETTEAVAYGGVGASRRGAGGHGAPRRGLPSAPRTVVADPSGAQQQGDMTRFSDQTAVHIPTRWMEGFYPIYAEAQSTFGVNWLLLASIHMQESAFSTAPSTYHGLNFAGCCGGPMQFNVTNGPVSTWQLVDSAYRYGKRPAAYDHQTARHPSIYDDFDSIMAAAWLLSSDGARTALDDSAWWAAYGYYGHDATGVTYADQVLSRAIGWSQHGFCINCGLEPGLVKAVHEAYGAPVLASLTTATVARAGHPAKRRG
jgi:hypothetical protein